MRLKEDDGSWKARSIKRRDFRHDPGTPEEAPHRKKKVKKAKPHCKHNYVVEWGWFSTKYYRCSLCGRPKRHRWSAAAKAKVRARLARGQKYRYSDWYE